MSLAPSSAGSRPRSGGPSTVRVAVLLPDVLGTYSDAGNATVLVERLRRRGIAAEAVQVVAGTRPPRGCDVYLLGGGEDTAQRYAAEWLRSHPRLLTALEGAQVLAVCAGLQLLGREVQLPDGRRLRGAGLLDLATVPGRTRAVGEVLTHCTEAGVPAITGFENHRGRTVLGPGARPLGSVVRGTGNGDGGDGVLTPAVVGTYLHGPVLARNPDLADFLLRRATGLELPPLDVPDQAAARRLHLAARWRRPARPALRRRLLPP